MNLDEGTESGFIYKAKKKDRERVNFLQSQRSPVDHRYKLAYKWLCYHPAVHTSNEKMWHHNMMAAGFATEFLSCLRSMLFSFLATHRDVSVFTPCLTFSHGFYFFCLSPSPDLTVTRSRNFSDPRKICSPNMCQQCNVEPETVQWSNKQQILHFITMPVCLHGSVAMPECVKS